MSKLTVYDMKGASTGEFDLPEAVLCLDRGEQAVHDAVTATRAAGRAGTASTLHKGEVAGSNKKPWRQKGTGRARAGLRQSPVWRGGGAAFGPKPRDYDKKVNRKVARLALRRAFSEKVAAGQIKVVEAFAVEVAKTRAFAAVLKALGVSAPALVVVGDAGQNILLASRNLARVEVVRGRDVNVYQLLRYPSVLVDRGGMAQIMERMGSKTEGAA